MLVIIAAVHVVSCMFHCSPFFGSLRGLAETRLKSPIGGKVSLRRLFRCMVAGLL